MGKVRSCVNYLKITEDNQMQSPYFRHKADQSHLCSARRGAWSPRLSITVMPRHEARSPRLSTTSLPKHEVWGLRPASRQWGNVEFKARVSAPLQCQKCEAQGPRLNAQMWSSRPTSSVTSMAKGWAQALVSTASEPCVSIVTIPITGSITAHVKWGVNPHYREILGDNFTLEPPINS